MPFRYLMRPVGGIVVVVHLAQRAELFKTCFQIFFERREIT